MHVALTVDPYILAGGVLLALGVVMGGLAARLRVPSLLLFLGLGMLVGDDGLGLVRFSDTKLVQTVAVVALVIILFDGGLSTPPHGLDRVVAPGALLATLGVAITASLVALAASFVLDLDWSTSLLIGAVVSSTDAAAVFSVLRGVPLPGRVSGLLELESGGNDPMAVLLTVGTLAAWEGGHGVEEFVRFGAVQVTGGLAVGLLIGVAASWCITRVRLPAASAYPVLALACGALAYGLAAAIGASGFLAVYLVGIVVGTTVVRHHRAIVSFHQGLGTAAQIGLFFLLGLLVFPSQLPSVAGKALVIAIVLVAARPLAVAACLPWFKFTRTEMVMISWSGLRGAVPIVLATFPLTAGHPDGQLIFDVVFFVVLVSAAVQGSTVAWVSHKLGLRADPDDIAVLAEIVPMETLDADVVRLVLGSSSSVVGQRLRAVPLPGEARVAIVVRQGRSFVPDGDTILEAADVVMVTVPEGQSSEPLQVWAEPGTAPGPAPGPTRPS